MGKLVVIEGACDGIGKSTQFNYLKEHLIKDGYVVDSHHFPSYNTYQGVPVEKYLSGEYGCVSELSPYFIHGLYAMDRAITWQTLLKNKYNDGHVILLDRYTTSSLLYQAALIEDITDRLKFVSYAEDYEYNKLGVQRPDNVIFLTAPFDLVTKIRSKRVDNEGVKNDIHERDIEFMKKVYENACMVAEYLNWNIIECSKNNEMRTVDDIHEDVYKLVRMK